MHIIRFNEPLLSIGIKSTQDQSVKKFIIEVYYIIIAIVWNQYILFLFRAFCNLVIITILYCCICEYYMLVLSAIFFQIFIQTTRMTKIDPSLRIIAKCLFVISVEKLQMSNYIIPVPFPRNIKKIFIYIAKLDNLQY